MINDDQNFNNVNNQFHIDRSDENIFIREAEENDKTIYFCKTDYCNNYVDRKMVRMFISGTTTIYEDGDAFEGENESESININLGNSKIKFGKDSLPRPSGSDDSSTSNNNLNNPIIAMLSGVIVTLVIGIGSYFCCCKDKRG